MPTSRKQTTHYYDKIVKELEAAPNQYKYRPWSEKEIDILKKYFPMKGAEALAKALNRTLESINCKTHKLGLRRGHERN